MVASPKLFLVFKPWLPLKPQLSILRLLESFTAWAKKALDLGPQGIMFPVIDDPDLAKKSVSYCWYPPNKVRGVAHPVATRVAEKAVLDSDSETYLAGCAMPNDGPVERKRRGYHLVCGGADVGLFRSATVDDVKKGSEILDFQVSDFLPWAMRRGNNGDGDGYFKASAQEIRPHFATLSVAFEH
nr:hypothetical protein CFP56_14895 [Quercus suber]